MGLETGVGQSAATRPPPGEQKPVPAGLGDKQEEWGGWGAARAGPALPSVPLDPVTPAGIAPRPSRCPLSCQVPGSAFQGVLIHSDLGSSIVRFGPQYRPPFSPGENQGRMLQLRRPLPPFCAVFPGLLLGLCVRVPRCLAPVVLSRRCLRVSEHPDPGPGIITASLLDLLIHRVLALRCLLPAL